MSQIILDISANTFKNYFHLIAQLIDKIKDIDTGKHEIIFKTQLFKDCPPNIPCHPQSLKFLMNYTRTSGYKATSSVFDEESLELLLKYDVPFIKIPCRPDLYWLVERIPRSIPVYLSYDNSKEAFEKLLQIENNNLFFAGKRDRILRCIRKYPAKIQEYEKLIRYYSDHGISDHTIGLELFKKYKFKIWEKHYVLEHDKDNPDAGEFAVTPEDLKEIL